MQALRKIERLVAAKHHAIVKQSLPNRDHLIKRGFAAGSRNCLVPSKCSRISFCTQSRSGFLSDVCLCCNSRGCSNDPSRRNYSSSIHNNNSGGGVGDGNSNSNDDISPNLERMQMRFSKGNLGKIIFNTLNSSFEPSVLFVDNESHMHSVPRNSETHFKITIVSPAFEGMSLVKRHRAVYDKLVPYMGNKDSSSNDNNISSSNSSNISIIDASLKTLHALAITAKTAGEWTRSGQQVATSPACTGGMKKEEEALKGKEKV